MARRLLLLLIAISVLLGGQALAQTEPECPESDFAEASPEYFVGIGNAYYAASSYARAVTAYTCALDLDPAYVPAFVERGYAFAAQFDFERALADYNRALELDEIYVQAYNNRGLMYTYQGNFGLAIGDFTLAVTLDPTYAEGYHNRGVVHAIEGNFDLAIADFEQAIALRDDYADPYAALAAVYSALAMQSYGDYYEIVGRTTAPLPAGSPSTVLRDVNTALTTEDFSVWLRLLTPAR